MLNIHIATSTQTTIDEAEADALIEQVMAGCSPVEREATKREFRDWRRNGWGEFIFASANHRATVAITHPDEEEGT